MSQARPDPDDEVTGLPAVVTPGERHARHFDSGMHPEIRPDADWRQDMKFGDEGGKFITDGDTLIGFLERNRCPVCGERGTLRVQKHPSFAHIRGAETRHGDGSTAKQLAEMNYHAIYCRAGGGDAVLSDRPNLKYAGGKQYIGVASPQAYREYKEWADERSERESFKGSARSLSRASQPETLLGRGHSKGLYLAAIYELLDVESYDTREYIDRGRVTKGQLASIIIRLQSLDMTPRDDYTESDWLITQDFGITHADVEWYVPEWVDFDGLRYSDHYRTRLFD